MDIKRSVLIVDDEKLNVMALSQILSPEYTVYAVMEGKDAISKAEEHEPDLILLDIVMPEMDGYEVITTLKENEITKDIPVIFITGLISKDEEEHGLALGAADYITKPFSDAVVKLRVLNQMKILDQMRIIIDRELSEKSQQAKLEFLMNISHDMMTPMNAIIGMTYLAKTSNDKTTLDDCLDEIDVASKSLLALLKNLFNASGGYKS